MAGVEKPARKNVGGQRAIDELDRGAVEPIHVTKPSAACERQVVAQFEFRRP